ncbi:MAG: aminopeptidase N [Rhizobiales bacterium]|nr:aminopeptidase N [Hyphomicrobiales bacterium]
MPQTIYLKDYKPSNYLITHTDLDFNLNETKTQTTAVLDIIGNVNNDDHCALILNGEGLKLLSINIDGTELTTEDYSYEKDLLTIFTPPNRPFKLTTIAETNPKANTSLSGLYLTHDVYCTQCEAEGFRKITFYLDRPDVLSTYKVRVEANKIKSPILLSNGNLLEEENVEGDDNRHFAIWHDPHPKPSYLFALVAGDLGSLSDAYIAADGREVALNIYVEPGKENDAVYAMGALKRSFKWDEDKFGRIYDLDIFNIVAVSHFNMGAMENKGLNIFNDKYILANYKTATDRDFELIESIIGHEYFHNWTGNRITCRDWFQLCLKEGLTVFRDAEFTSDLRSRPVKRVDDVKILRVMQFAEDAGPLAHPCRPESFIEINNFYTATVYRKGAEVVRALHSLVGADHFRASMDYYFDNFDGQAATVKDFLYCFEQVTGRDLSQFDRWYSQAGTPTLKYITKYNSEKQTYTLTIEQSSDETPNQPFKQNYHMPIKLGLLDANGTDLALVLNGEKVKNSMVEITNKKHEFIFENITSKPILSFLRDFSVPVKVDVKQSFDELLFLMANDSDLFNRWQAGQTAAMNLIIELLKTEVADDILLDSCYAKAINKSLKNTGLEDAFKGLILTMPSVAEIALFIGENIDHNAIYKARKKLVEHIALVNEQDLLSMYHAYNKDQSFEPNAHGSGVRSLRNIVLQSLVTTNNPEYKKLAIKHYKLANNMVDLMGSLSTLSGIDGFEVEPYLDDFYNRFKTNHIVIDKWFGIQASNVAIDTLSKVKKLTEHKDFTFEKPNNVYALIGGFANGNPVSFNAADGSGYEFIADTIIQLDSINSQVAARMLTPLKSWKSLEPGRRALAKKALQKIVNVNNLSNDVYELATKSLGI